MSKFTLTTEQQEIIETSTSLKPDDVLLVNAFAGTGKTSTLIEISKANPYKRFLYIAFNKAVVIESKKKFPKNVSVMTLHSLAIRALNINLENVRENDYDIISFAELFGLDYTEYDYIEEALKYFKQFCSSSEEFPDAVFEDNKLWTHAGRQYFLEFWRFLDEGQLNITHDFYLKKFSLSDSKIKDISSNYDICLLDEMQDSNPVSLSIFNKFSCAKIFVGDKHQQIYQFRGSVNAMESINAGYSFYLTNTFRCNEHVVSLANDVLKQYLGSTKFLISKNIEKNYKIKTIGYIARTNSSLIEVIKIFMEAKIHFSLTKKPIEVFRGAINLHYFLTGEFEKIYKEYSFLKKFKNEAALKEYAERYKSVDLQMNLKIAKRYKKGLFLLLQYAKTNLEQSVSTEEKIFLTTAHASKGLEWDKIILAKDFKDLKDIEDEKELIEEANLLYVTYTRAKYEIEFLE